MKEKYKYWTTTRENCRTEYKCTSFAIETTSEYKYQIAMETVEQNTSKQVSTKKTALQNVYKYSKSFFFFKKQSEYGETKARK